LAQFRDLDLAARRSQEHVGAAFDDHVGCIRRIALREEALAARELHPLAREGEELQARRVDVAEHRHLPQGLHLGLKRHS
jgi:hypothetical protein